MAKMNMLNWLIVQTLILKAKMKSVQEMLKATPDGVLGSTTHGYWLGIRHRSQPKLRQTVYSRQRGYQRTRR